MVGGEEELAFYEGLESDMGSGGRGEPVALVVALVALGEELADRLSVFDGSLGQCSVDRHVLDLAVDVDECPCAVGAVAWQLSQWHVPDFRYRRLWLL
jgi:hypothetical protein